MTYTRYTPETLRRRIERLRHESDLSDPNRNAILSFLDECAAEGLSVARQMRYIYLLRTIAVRMAPSGFSFPDATETDLKQVVAAIHRSTTYAEATKADFKKAIKKYYKVLYGGTPPEMIAFIRATLKKATPVTREDIFSPEEVRSIISRLRNIRDKAFIMVLYEAGARPSELLGCKISDVTFNEDGDFIFLQGIKGTPDRTNQLIEAGTLLREWLRYHPCGGDPHDPREPSAPLWVKLEQTRCRKCGVPSQFHEQNGCEAYEPLEVEELRYDCIRLNFKAACRKAELKKKRLRMYSLRHSRITEVSKFMSNQQLCKFAGWKPGSGQFEVYVHLSNDDVNHAIREHYGMDSGTSEKYEDCPICGQRNPAGSLECRRCKRPLGLKSSTKVDEIRQAVSFIAELKEQGKLDALLKLARQVH